MNNPPAAQTPIAAVISQILALIPGHLRTLVEPELPTLSVSAARLGLEVLDAEQRSIGFPAAVERSAEFPLMGRVYFGAINLLQWQVPPAMRGALRSILAQALVGEFDSTRQLLFLIAQRKSDPEAALCRFLLWAAVRINLLILTWDQARIESIGVLDDMEHRAEEVLRRLLQFEDIGEPDFRPLHVLIAKLLVDTYKAAAPLLMGAMTALEMEIGDALQLVRGLEARDAAVFRPGRFTGAPGSQQLLDRFPQHHYRSTNAIEQQRSRICKRAAGLRLTQGRFIDLILDVEGRDA